LREQGICLDDKNEATYDVQLIHDFWLIDISSPRLEGYVTVAVSWHPDVKTDVHFDNEQYRSRLKRTKILEVGEGGFLVISRRGGIPYIHVYRGSPKDRRAALQLVTFCDP